MSDTNTEVEEYLEAKKEIQTQILEVINNEIDDPSLYENLNDFFQEHKIHENWSEVRATLHLLLQIANNHHRVPGFLDKIIKILLLFQDKIKQTFSNFRLFYFFRSNKAILYFLFKQKLIEPDQQMFNLINTSKYVDRFYPHFFYPEFKSFFKSNSTLFKDPLFKKAQEDYNSDPELFDKKRKIGENDTYIYTLIQNDSVEEFITYVNKTNFKLSSDVGQSIFETNSYLLKNKPTIIEYACFFGSIKVFNYLRMSKVDLTSSLWIYAIHGNNAELYHILEDNHVFQDNSSAILIESMKCHHIYFTNYINLNNSNIENMITYDVLVQALKLYAYNYNYTYHDLFDMRIVFYLCQNDYEYIVKLLLNKMAINSVVVFKIEYFLNIIFNELHLI